MNKDPIAVYFQVTGSDRKYRTFQMLLEPDMAVIDVVSDQVLDKLKELVQETIHRIEEQSEKGRE